MFIIDGLEGFRIHLADLAEKATPLIMQFSLAGIRFIECVIKCSKHSSTKKARLKSTQYCIFSFNV